MTPLGNLVVVAVGAVAAHRTKQAASEASSHPELTDADRVRVGAWVTDEIQRLRALSYDELLLHGARTSTVSAFCARGPTSYARPSVIWDDPDARTLRIFVDAAQRRPGWSSPSVAKDDFIRAPDGSFIDE